MSEFFSDEQVLTITEEVVAEAGHDYVYASWPGINLGNGCHYVREGECSCLIARIAHRMGAPIEWLAQYENTDALVVCGYPPPWFTKEVPPNTYFQVTRKAAEALSSAQAAQDGGSPWGVALDRMRSVLGHAID